MFAFNMCFSIFLFQADNLIFKCTSAGDELKTKLALSLQCNEDQCLVEDYYTKSTNFINNSHFFFPLTIVTKD